MLRWRLMGRRSPAPILPALPDRDRWKTLRDVHAAWSAYVLRQDHGRELTHLLERRAAAERTGEDAAHAGDARRPRRQGPGGGHGRAIEKVLRNSFRRRILLALEWPPCK